MKPLEQNYLGKYPNLEALWAQYHSSAKDGDYATINGVSYHWHKYQRKWIDASTYHEEAISIYKELYVQGDLYVGGTLIAKDVQPMNCGLFHTEEALIKTHPSLRIGYFVLVGDTEVCKIYVCSKLHLWKDSGRTANIATVSVDVRAITDKINALREDTERSITSTKSKLSTANTELSSTLTTSMDALRTDLNEDRSAREQALTALRDSIPSYSLSSSVSDEDGSTIITLLSGCEVSAVTLTIPQPQEPAPYALSQRVNPVTLRR